MNVVGKFEKVSFDQFCADAKTVFAANLPEADVRKIYDGITVPRRATANSAGYDFVSPIGFSLAPGETIKIPSGIRAIINPGWFLGIFPRSSLGFKYRLQLDNSVGVIDADYSFSDNEGHIFIKLTNDGRNGQILNVTAGSAIVQGIFMEFGITTDDNATATRNGGFGSTDSKENDK